MIQPMMIHTIGHAMENGIPRICGSGERTYAATGQVTASRLSTNTPTASLLIVVFDKARTQKLPARQYASGARVVQIQRVLGLVRKTPHRKT